MSPKPGKVTIHGQVETVVSNHKIVSPWSKVAKTNTPLQMAVVWLGAIFL